MRQNLRRYVYTGHMRVTCKDGRTIEAVQPHLRGGKREPLTEQELEAKFLANVQFGGWPAPRAHAVLETCRALLDAPDMSGLAALRE